jgi:hypothetical protein
MSGLMTRGGGLGSGIKFTRFLSLIMTFLSAMKSSLSSSEILSIQSSSLTASDRPGGAATS